MYQNNYRITDDGFGVHTFELTIPSITREEFERLSDKAEKRYSCNHGNNICIYPRQHGVRIYLNHTDLNFYNIKVIVSPRRLIDENAEAVSILRSADDFNLLESRVNAVLGEYLGDEYTMDSFSLSRIDCCVNIMLSESFSAERFVKLIRRSMIYSDSAEIITYPDDVPDADIKNKHIFRINTSDVTFTAYDKYFQLEDIGENYEAASEALLRLELAVNRDIIRDIANSVQEGISNIELIGFFTYYSRECFEKYIKRHFFTGDYCYIADMRSLIEKSVLKKKAKARMMVYAELQCDKRSFPAAKKSMCQILDSEPKLKRMLKNFESLDVYPISLSYRDKHGGKAVPGLHTILGL